MKDSPKRTLAKTVSWRICATVITMIVALIITGEAAVSLGIGLADSVFKMFAYYGHERAWNRSSFGVVRPHQGEYGDGI